MIKFVLLAAVLLLLYGVWYVAGPEGRKAAWSAVGPHIPALTIIVVVLLSVLMFALNGIGFKLF